MSKLNDYFNIVASCDIGKAYCVVVTAENLPGIFLVDKETMRITPVGILERFTEKKPKIACMVYYNGFVLVVPSMDVANRFFINVDLKTNSINYIDITNSDLNCLYTYCAFFQENEKIWFFPFQVKENLVIYNMFTNEFEVVNSWKKALEFLEIDENYSPGPGQPICVNSKIYITITTLYYIVEIDKETKQIVLHELPKNCELAFPMTYDGENFWVMQAYNKGLLYWNPEKGVLNNIKMTWYNNHICEKMRTHAWFRNVLLGNRYIWLTIACDKRLVRIDKRDNTMELVSFVAEDQEHEEIEEPYCNGVYRIMDKQEKRIAVMFGNMKEIFFLDLAQDKMRKSADKVDFSSLSTRALLKYVGKNVFLRGDNLKNLISYLIVGAE